MSSETDPQKPVRLHLGCGERYLEGYANIDFPPSEHTTMTVKADQYADIRTLSYPENSVDEIRTEHMFEHFSRQEALKLIANWRHWLKPGGTLHIETPDFGACAFWYPWSSLSRRFELSRHVFGSQDAKWAFHYDGWDKKKFAFVLKRFGFTDISIKKYPNSVGKRYRKIPFAGFIGRLIPRSMYRRHGGNKLPDIVAIAKKDDTTINDRLAITDVLKLSLVGPEGDKVLMQWLKDINY